MIDQAKQDAFDAKTNKVFDLLDRDFDVEQMPEDVKTHLAYLERGPELAMIETAMAGMSVEESADKIMEDFHAAADPVIAWLEANTTAPAEA